MLDMIIIVLPLLKEVGKDMSVGRIIESLTILTIIWMAIKPHLKQIENEIKGTKEAVTAGFNKFEDRFKSVESRVSVLEKKD